MTKVIGVRFRTAGKVYFFDPLQFEIKRGDHVIVKLPEALSSVQWYPVCMKWRRIRSSSP